MRTQKANKGRRNFLFALGAAGVGAAAVAVTRQAAEAPQVVAGAEPQQGRGYQVTDHVRTYYRTARV